MAKRRFTDNSAAGRLLWKMFTDGELKGDEKPSDVRSGDLLFMQYESKQFADKFRKFAERLNEKSTYELNCEYAILTHF